MMIKSPNSFELFQLNHCISLTPSSNTFCLTRNSWVTTPHTCKYTVFKFNQQIQQIPTKNCKLIDWRWRIFKFVINFFNCYWFSFYKFIYMYILWRCQIIFQCSHPSAHNHQSIKCLLSCRKVGVGHMQNIPQHESATMITSRFGLCCSQVHTPPSLSLTSLIQMQKKLTRQASYGLPIILNLT
jgi:hypothetical protein